MSKILIVAQKEFLETVKSKIFLVNLFLMPIIMGAGIVISTKLAKKSIEGPRPAKTIVVADLSKQLRSDLENAFAQYNKFNPQRQIVLKQSDADDSDSRTQELQEQVRQGKMDAALVIGKDSVEGNAKSYYYTKTRNVMDLDLFSTVQRLVNDAVVAKRSRQRNVSPQLLAEIHRWVSVEQVDVSAKVGEKREEVTMMMIPFFFLFLMFMGVFATNQQILTSVIEEKNSRVMEVILATVSPFQLMGGKILGLAGAGFTLVAVWGTAGYAAASVRGLHGVVTPGILACFAVYFILGFLLISSVFAAIGSACNTLKEAQSMMLPVMMIFIIPMFVWFYITQHPQAPLSIVLSFVPPITAMIMILRIAACPELPLFQIILSIIVLAASVPTVMWASAKIFRTGILMYGKPPSLRELLRWVRYS
jgi:ABC-2 type transport system permease protein